MVLVLVCGGKLLRIWTQGTKRNRGIMTRAEGLVKKFGWSSGRELSELGSAAFFPSRRSPGGSKAWHGGKNGGHLKAKAGPSWLLWPEAAGLRKNTQPLPGGDRPWTSSSTWMNRGLSVGLGEGEQGPE